MPEAATRDHRHVATAGGRDRCQQEADLVADATRRMLVDDRPVETFSLPFEHRSRGSHGERQLTGLLRGHRVQEYGHGQGRYLLCRDAAIGKPVHEIGDLPGRQLATVALFPDDVRKQQVESRFQLNPRKGRSELRCNQFSAGQWQLRSTTCNV